MAHPMYTATLHTVIGPPWSTMEPIQIGRAPRGDTIPGAFLLVESGGIPHARVDIHPEYCWGAFQELIVWEGFIVLGWGDVVHLIDPVARAVRGIPCDGYFGYLHPLGDRLLIASSSELICLDRRGDELWRADGLGIDGVIVGSVEGGVVEGEGEWDPPGGWRRFRVMLESGEVLEEKEPPSSGGISPPGAER